MHIKRENVQIEKEIDKSDHGDVTIACDDDQEKEAHKEGEQNVNTKNNKKTKIEITLNTMAGGGKIATNVKERKKKINLKTHT